MASWTTVKTLTFIAEVPAIEDGCTVLHQLKCEHKLGLFQTVLDLKQDMAGHSKEGSIGQARDPLGHLSTASTMMLFIDPGQFQQQQQDEAQNTSDAIARSVVGSVERSGMMFWGHPMRDFLPAILPDKVIVQLKPRQQKHVMVMDSLVKGQFRLTRGKLFSTIHVGQDGADVELWEGKLSEFDEEMLLTLLWERPVMRYKELPDYLKVKEYASLAVFAVSQQLEVFEQLPTELQTHGEVIEAAIVKDCCRAKDFLPAPVIQQANVRAILVKCEKAARARKALINEELKATHQKATATSQGRGRTSQGKGGSSQDTWNSWDWTGRTGQDRTWTWTGQGWTGHWNEWW